MSISSEPILKTHSPFDLDNIKVYLKWREKKLKKNNPTLSDLLVPINNPFQLNLAEKKTIVQNCYDYNMAIYQLPSEYIKNDFILAIGKTFDLTQLDANLGADENDITTLQVREQKGNHYIPYTDKPLSWHTDGYYNHLDKQIFGIILHCINPAVEGGVNGLVNHENLYIALRDENPDYIKALMHPEAMTIPENIDSGKLVREAQTGPVFMVKPDGRLHMRYSARKRNIVWRDDATTQQAVLMIEKYLANKNNFLSAKLNAGQGVICNNVLHNRSGFNDSADSKRLYYRARYYDSVTNKNNGNEARNNDAVVK